MKYDKVVKELDKVKFRKNNLDRFKELLTSLDNPQKDQRYVHIAGTSGKGSTAIYLANILQESSYKAGVHTSPHLTSYRDRVKINNEKISKKEFAEIYTQIENKIKNINNKFEEPVSLFEITLAIAFIYFKSKKTDINIIEAGIGGRNDITNVISSKYQIITNIGLDHVERLGGTKESILKHKQDIIKSKSTVVSGIKQKNLIPILNKKIKKTNSKLLLLNKSFNCLNIDKQNKTFTYNLISKDTEISNITLPHQPFYQIVNSALAAVCALNLQKDLEQINKKTIKKGIKQAVLAGKFEILNKNPLVIFDSAHNPDKIKSFAKSVKQIYPSYKFTTILRFRDTDYFEQILDEVKKISEFIWILYKKKSHKDKVKKYISHNVDTTNNLQETLDSEKNKVKNMKNKGILITGSSYVYKELMRDGRERGF